MDPEEFRRHAHRMADWIADYMTGVEALPVRARTPPGAVAAALPDRAPEDGEAMADRHPQTAIAPSREISTRRPPRRKRLRQHAPRTAGAKDVQDGVDRLAQIRAAPAPQRLVGPHVGRNRPPFRLSRIACMAAAIAHGLRASDFSPHVAPRRLAPTTDEHNRLESLNSFRNVLSNAIALQSPAFALAPAAVLGYNRLVSSDTVAMERGTLAWRPGPGSPARTKRGRRRPPAP